MRSQIQCNARIFPLEIVFLQQNDAVFDFFFSVSHSLVRSVFALSLSPSRQSAFGVYASCDSFKMSKHIDCEQTSFAWLNKYFAWNPIERISDLRGKKRYATCAVLSGLCLFYCLSHIKSTMRCNAIWLHLMAFSLYSF